MERDGRSGRSDGMSHEPTAAEIRSYADQHGLTDDQARELLAEQGHDETGLGEALKSLKHFLKAPS